MASMERARRCGNLRLYAKQYACRAESELTFQAMPLILTVNVITKNALTEVNRDCMKAEKDPSRPCSSGRIFCQFQLE